MLGRLTSSLSFVLLVACSTAPFSQQFPSACAIAQQEPGAGAGPLTAEVR